MADCTHFLTAVYSKWLPFVGVFLKHSRSPSASLFRTTFQTIPLTQTNFQCLNKTMTVLLEYFLKKMCLMVLLITRDESLKAQHSRFLQLPFLQVT